MTADARYARLSCQSAPSSGVAAGRMAKVERSAAIRATRRYARRRSGVPALRRHAQVVGSQLAKVVTCRVQDEGWACNGPGNAIAFANDSGIIGVLVHSSSLSDERKRISLQTDGKPDLGAEFGSKFGPNVVAATNCACPAGFVGATTGSVRARRNFRNSAPMAARQVDPGVCCVSAAYRTGQVRGVRRRTTRAAQGAARRAHAQSHHPGGLPSCLKLLIAGDVA